MELIDFQQHAWAALMGFLIGDKLFKEAFGRGYCRHFFLFALVRALDTPGSGESILIDKYGMINIGWTHLEKDSSD